MGKRTGLLPSGCDLEPERFLARDMCRLNPYPIPPSAASPLPESGVIGADASPPVIKRQRSPATGNEEVDHFFGFALSPEATAFSSADDNECLASAGRTNSADEND